MIDKPMTPSERAARKVITEIYANPAPESDVSEIAAIIARETGCDTPDPAREIVRRLWEFTNGELTNADCLEGDGYGILANIVRDAAALHAAGGKDNG